MAMTMRNSTSFGAHGNMPQDECVIHRLAYVHLTPYITMQEV